jgi:hypothetical protein
MTTQPKTIVTRPSGASTIRQPVPLSQQEFKTGGREYVKLTFREDLNLYQTTEMAEGMEGARMLTHQEAIVIVSNPTLSAVFKEKMKIGEWTFVRDPDLELMSRAACLYRGGFGWGLGVFGDGGPGDVSRVVVLEKIGSGAAVQEVPPKILRLERGEALEVILSDGKPLILDAIQATIIRKG